MRHLILSLGDNRDSLSQKDLDRLASGRQYSSFSSHPASPECGLSSEILYCPVKFSNALLFDTEPHHVAQAGLELTMSPQADLKLSIPLISASLILGWPASITTASFLLHHT